MTSTRYIVNHQGRSWYLTDKDTEIIQYWKERGATIKAETTSEHDARGIPMDHVGDRDLERLEQLALKMDWQQVLDMVRNEEQKRIKQ